MRSKQIIIIHFIIPLIFYNVSSIAQSIKWPEEWPVNMSLKTSYCCGLKPDLKTIFISTDNSYVEENTEERPKQYIKLSFNQPELKELLVVLKKNNVVGIKSSPSKNATLDKGISSLIFTYDGKNYTSTLSATEQLNANAKQRFYAIINYVDKLIEKKRLTAKINFIFRFDKSVIRSGKELHIKLEQPETEFTFKADGIPSSAVIDLVPGEYAVQVKLIDPRKPEETSGEAYVAQADIKIDTHKNEQITLLLEGQQLKFHY